MSGTTPLPELRGSEKQVAWANDLRQQVLAELDKLEARARELGGWEHSLSAIEKGRTWVARQAEARMFIDFFRTPERAVVSTDTPVGRMMWEARRADNAARGQ